MLLALAAILLASTDDDIANPFDSLVAMDSSWGLARDKTKTTGVAMDTSWGLARDKSGFVPTETRPWVAGTCSDGIQNQGETGIDCGGPCNACPCSYGIQSQGETGIDCGAQPSTEELDLRTDRLELDLRTDFANEPTAYPTLGLPPAGAYGTDTSTLIDTFVNDEQYHPLEDFHLYPKLDEGWRSGHTLKDEVAVKFVYADTVEDEVTGEVANTSTSTVLQMLRPAQSTIVYAPSPPLAGPSGGGHVGSNTSDLASAINTIVKHLVSGAPSESELPAVTTMSIPDYQQSVIDEMTPTQLQETKATIDAMQNLSYFQLVGTANASRASGETVVATEAQVPDAGSVRAVDAASTSSAVAIVVPALVLALFALVARVRMRTPSSPVSIPQATAANFL